MVDSKHEVSWAAVKSLPAGFGLWLYSFTLEDMVAFATLIYILLQTFVLIEKRWFPNFFKRKKKDVAKDS